MEQTIGKRIAQNRKRLGLTQDALAEKLGVTAQAVSKWENDQSCPDITTLPKLAAIFGISTDELLGMGAVHEAEVVTEEEKHQGIHVQKGLWELKWDSGKKDAMTFAVLVLFVGALTLFSRIFSCDISFWEILWPSALLIYGIAHLLPRFSIFSLGCALFGGYYLIHNLGFWEFTIAGELIFPIAVVLFGVGLLIDALRKPKKPKFYISKNGVKLGSDKDSQKPESHFSSEEDSFDCSLSFGEKTQYVQLPRLRYGNISCSFGVLTVDLSGCKEVCANCRIDAKCSFGELILLVPKQYTVHPDSHTAFAGLSFEGQPEPVPQGIIELDANVSFGEIQVRYI